MPQLHLITIPTTPAALDLINEDPGQTPCEAFQHGAAKQLLRAAFQDQAPQNFLWQPGSGISAYFMHPADRVIQAAQRNLPPYRLRDWSIRHISSEPTPHWREDEPYEFAVRVMPTRRLTDPSTGRTREFEVIHRDATVQQRDAAYQEWLDERISPWECAELEFVWTARYQPGPITEHLRQKPQPTLAAHLSGELRITDPDRFDEMLRHGVGRHRNRGYDTMLIDDHCRRLD